MAAANKENVSRETVCAEMLKLIEQVRSVCCGSINCVHCPFDIPSNVSSYGCFAIIASKTRGAVMERGKHNDN